MFEENKVVLELDRVKLKRVYNVWCLDDKTFIKIS